MGKFKDLSPRKVGQINVLLSVGTLKQKEIAKKLNVSTQSVSNIKKKMENSQNLNSSRVGKCGRKRKTSSRMDRKIIKEALLNRRLTCRQISFQLAAEGVILARRTVNKRLLEVGLKAKNHVEWTSEQWEKMVKTKGAKKQFANPKSKLELSPSSSPKSDEEYRKSEDEDQMVIDEEEKKEELDEEEEEEEDDEKEEEEEDDEKEEDEKEEDRKKENEIMESIEEEAVDPQETKAKKAKSKTVVKGKEEPQRAGRSKTTKAANATFIKSPVGKLRENLAIVMKAKGRGQKTGSKEPDKKTEKVNPADKKINMLRLVLNGLSQLDSRKGVSFTALKKYVLEMGDAQSWERIRPRVKFALEKGLEENLIVRPKGNDNVTGLQGSFKLNKKQYTVWQKGPEKEKPKKEETILKVKSTITKSVKLTPKKTSVAKKVLKQKHRRSVSDEMKINIVKNKRLKKSKSMEQLSAAKSKKSPSTKTKKTTPKEATPKKIKKKA